MKRVVKAQGLFVAANAGCVCEMEVKYRISAEGFISEISKQVRNAQGEVIGTNKVEGVRVNMLIDTLIKCAGHDYFEHGIELCLFTLLFSPIDISDLQYVEVDFPAEIDHVRKFEVFAPQ